MQKNFSSSDVPAFKRSGTIDFDTEKFKPTSDSVKITRNLMRFLRKLKIAGGETRDEKTSFQKKKTEYSALF